MATLAFDTLRYAKRLEAAGVSTEQAEVQAELMAEAFGFYADNLVTRDFLEEVLRARFGEMENRFEQRFNRIESTLKLHGWILGIIAAATIVPQLAALAN